MLRVFSRVKTFDYVHNMCLSKESSGHVEAYQISSVLNHVGLSCRIFNLSKQSLCNIL